MGLTPFAQLAGCCTALPSKHCPPPAGQLHSVVFVRDRHVSCVACPATCFCSADSPGAGGERQYITEFTSGAEAAADTGHRDSKAQVARYAHVFTPASPAASLLTCRLQLHAVRQLQCALCSMVRAHLLGVCFDVYCACLLTAAVLPSLTPCLTDLTLPSGVVCSRWQQQHSQCMASSE